jgi:hypothetical protein
MRNGIQLSEAITGDAGHDLPTRLRFGARRHCLEARWVAICEWPDTGMAEDDLGGEMAAYLVVEHTITDPAKFEEYRARVGPMIAKHGGRYLTKGGDP